MGRGGDSFWRLQSPAVELAGRVALVLRQVLRREPRPPDWTDLAIAGARPHALALNREGTGSRHRGDPAPCFCRGVSRMDAAAQPGILALSLVLMAPSREVRSRTIKKPISTFFRSIADAGAPIPADPGPHHSRIGESEGRLHAGLCKASCGFSRGPQRFHLSVLPRNTGLPASGGARPLSVGFCARWSGPLAKDARPTRARVLPAYLPVVYNITCRPDWPPSKWLTLPLMTTELVDDRHARCVGWCSTSGCAYSPIEARSSARCRIGHLSLVFGH